MTVIGGYVRGLFPVRRDERGLVLFLYALLTLMVLADWIAKVGTNSLLVKRVSVQVIPVMYIVTPLVLLAASMALFALVGRMLRRTLLFWYVGIVMVASGALQLALPLGGVTYTVGYIFTHIVKETIYLIFWVYAGNLFDSEQSKRIFPLFAGALLVGKIAGGVASTALADTIHSENFVGVQAVGFALCLGLLGLYRRHLPEGEGDIAARGEQPKGVRASVADSVAGYRAVASDRLLRPFGVNIFLWYFLMQLGNYLYLVGLDTSTQAGTTQQQEDAFSLLYAAFYTGGSLAALAIQTFFTGGILRRLGVSLVLFVFPLWYVGSYAGALMSFNLLTSFLIQLGERVVVPAIHLPATQVVYNQLASALRPRARAFLSGGVNALGNIAAAGLLLAGAAIGGRSSSTTILQLATAFSGVFVLNTWFVRKSLGLRIAENLASGDAELRRNAVQMLPGEASAVPTAALRRVLADAESEGRGGLRTSPSDDAWYVRKTYDPEDDVEESVTRVLLRRGALEPVVD